MGKLQSKNSDDKKSVGVLVVHIVADPENPLSCRCLNPTMKCKASFSDSPRCVLLSLG